MLVIEGEAELGSAISVLLRGRGFSVAVATARSEGFQLAASRAFDLILLDVMLPTNDGLLLCRDVRRAARGIPILVLTDRARVAEMLPALRRFTDDYVTKPPDTADLLLRIEVLLQQRCVRPIERSEGSVAIKIDARNTRVTRDGRPVFMTSHEFQLLHYLIKRAGRCVTRGELLKTVWGYAGNATTRTIDVHIASLRKKLETNPKEPAFIRTIPKVGYMFVQDGDIPRSHA